MAEWDYANRQIGCYVLKESFNFEFEVEARTQHKPQQSVSF